MKVSRNFFEDGIVVDVSQRISDNARRLAGVMELVDVPDSKSGAARRGGSSPPPGTT